MFQKLLLNNYNAIITLTMVYNIIYDKNHYYNEV